MLDRLRDNLASVRERIATAAARSGRTADQVRLIGVTKYVAPEIARQLVAAELFDLGESRPQELWHKAAALADLPAQWHMIGHLQRNKIARTLPIVGWIHSGDSLRLLDALSAEGLRQAKRVDCLLEVNISGDPTKHGFAPEELEAALSAVAELPGVKVHGLMAMAGLEGGRDRAQRDFAAVRALRDRLLPVAPAEVSLRELSLGMSDDFDLAIAAGATMVRVGSALFEGIDD